MSKAVLSPIVVAAAAVHLVACSGGNGTADSEAAAHESHGSHDSHVSHDAAATVPPDGELWPTDEALRAGMSRIDAAVERSIGMTRPLTREQAGELARAVEENVRFIIENCRLPPEPDAALHGLIGRMLAVISELKSDAPADAAVTRLARVLQDYRDTFDHRPTPSGEVR